ncbi:Uncharacterised protein [Klebsiella pneumoniae]|nr:Uncharacterised protein [Klebsiella pneumoniae]
MLISFRASNAIRSFCACICTGPWFAISLIPSFRTNTLSALPTPMNRFFTTLTSAFFPAVAIRLCPAETCRCSPLVSAIPSGALTSSTDFLRSVSCCSSRVICAWRSAGFAVAFCASPEMDIICSRASARLLTAGSISSTCPRACTCPSALINIPFCARIAPRLSVLSSKPSPRGCLSLSTRCPRFSWLLPPYSVESLICSFPRSSSRRILLLAGVRRTLRLSLRMVTWSPCAESCSTPAIYGRSGLPSSKPIATSVPASSGRCRP